MHSPPSLALSLALSLPCPLSRSLSRALARALARALPLWHCRTLPRSHSGTVAHSHAPTLALLHTPTLPLWLSRTLARSHIVARLAHSHIHALALLCLLPCLLVHVSPHTRWGSACHLTTPPLDGRSTPRACATPRALQMVTGAAAASPAAFTPDAHRAYLKRVSEDSSAYEFAV